MTGSSTRRAARSARSSSLSFRRWALACSGGFLIASLSSPPASYFVGGVRITPSDLGLSVDELLDDENNNNDAAKRPTADYREEEEARNDAVRSLRRLRKGTQPEAQDPPASPADHRVEGLPLLDADGPASDLDMYAGLLNASPDGHKKLFYWLVAPPGGLESDTDRDESEIPPLLIWLNGGPGCSSMEGFFLENGPLKFVLGGSDGDDDKARPWKLVANPYSWHLSPAWVLYIDQPVGTGLSFTTQGDYCKNDMEVNEDFVYFLEEFLLLHREAFLAEDGGEGTKGGGPPRMRRPLYFSGESHAGHYIPSMMDYILARQNPPRPPPPEDNPADGSAGGSGSGRPLRVLVDLRGAAVGNGWTDPYHQYSAAAAAYGHGLISLSQKSHLDDMERSCLSKLDAGTFRSGVCFDLLDDITKQSHGGNGGTVACKYDVSKYLPRGRQGLFPPGQDLVEAYLGGNAPPKVGNWDGVGDYKTDVLGALHATESADAGQRFRDCTDAPYRALAHQDGLGVVDEVSRVLDFDNKDAAGPVRLLFFNGMNDLVCNHVGNEVALQKLPWSKADIWAVAPRYAWRLGDDMNVPPVGFIQEAANLSFLKLPNAGHMVPMDQPVVALEMIRTFIYNRSFQSSKQNMEGRDPTEKSC